MGTTGSSFGWKATRALALALALIASACSDDDGSGDEGGGDEPTGEACMNPRMTMVGCSCGAGFGEGRRRCGEDGFWEECICPMLNDAGQLRCTPGQRVICRGCGLSESWDSVCSDEGEALCDCDTAPGAGDGDGDGDTAGDGDSSGGDADAGA